MRNFYLFELALKVGTVEALENGIVNLNEILVNRDEERDKFLCNGTIWECDTTLGKIYDLFGGVTTTISFTPATRAGMALIKTVDGNGAVPPGTYNPTR